MAVTTNKKATGKGSRAESTRSRGSAKSRGDNIKGGASSKKSRKNTAVPVPEPPSEDFIGAEVLILLSFAVAVLLFLSNFHLCGAAGNYLRMFQLGVFGMVGFIAPLLLFVGTCFYLSNRENLTAMRKLLASVALVLVLCGLVQLLFGTHPEEGTGLMEYYRLSSEKGTGGGLIGGLICMALTAVLGNIGAFLVLIVCLAISVVCITERSLVKAVKRQSGAAYRYAREDMDRRRELHAERQEERHRQRQEQRVRGVDLIATDFSVSKDSEEFLEEYTLAEEPPKQEREEYEEEYVTVDEEQKEPAQQKEEKNDEKDPADVFTGKITMSPHYPNEDFVPFEADNVLSPAESAQRLVAEGISHLSDWEGSFGKPVKPPSFPPPASEPAFHGLETVLEEPVETNSDLEDDSAYSLEPIRLTSPVSKYEEDGPDEIFMEEAEEEEKYLPEILESPEDEREGLMKESAQKKIRQEPLAVETWRQESERAFSEKPAVLPYQIEWSKEEPEAVDDPVEEIWDEIDKPTGGIHDDNFVIPEESKRVVTASGKVIESDTEALQKRLESKRKEAKEAREAGEICVQQQIREKESIPKKEYIFPPVTLLKRGNLLSSANSQQEYKDTAIKLQQTLRDFGVGVTVTNISCGPSVTRYELHPEQGVKVSKIVGLADDIKLSLAAADIRIEAPIPGKSAVGIEVPNKENTTVYLRELLESEAFRSHSSRMAFAVGKDIGGQVVVTDIAKMPHLLIAGATGSGKSVCINTLIMSILFKSSPEDVKLIMVDPKVVELSVYNGIPHLLIPVVTDPKKASGALNWAVAEMQDRYKKFAECNVRNLKGYNSRIESLKDVPEEERPPKMPQIVIIVDELADLMMVAPGEVEDAICRLAQLARAAGIHLVIATQRPSVNVITGLIKANVPSRIAFSVSSGVDSRTIIDMHGAEKLLGKGDMLFFPSGIPKPQRVQGAFVSDSEVQKVVEFLSEQGLTAEYDPNVEKQMNAAPVAGPTGNSGGSGNGRDEYFEQAGRFIIEKEKASIGMLQRMFKIGFNRAARIMDQLADAGVVGEEEGTKPRKILVTMEEFEELLGWEE